MKGILKSIMLGVILSLAAWTNAQTQTNTQGKQGTADTSANSSNKSFVHNSNYPSGPNRAAPIDSSGTIRGKRAKSGTGWQTGSGTGSEGATGVRNSGGTSGSGNTP